MTLLERTSIHAHGFEIEDQAAYFVQGPFVPNHSEANCLPQPNRCWISRLHSGIASHYWLNRSARGARVPATAPFSVVVVHLEGEKLCFRMDALLFFGASLHLSTIVNLQGPWITIENPFVCCIEGTGSVGFLVTSQARLLSRRGDEPALPAIRLPRLIAWSSETVARMSASSAVLDSALGAHGVAEIERSPLIVAASSDRAGLRRHQLLRRLFPFSRG